jgi:hypothetical protein
MLRRGGPPELSLGKLADELKEKLAENPPINRLATNPLMCARTCNPHCRGRTGGQKKFTEAELGSMILAT